MGPFGRGEAGTDRQITRSLVWRMRHGEVIWDSELQGFGIEAGNDGKLYFLESAIGGERRRYLIGRHGEPWTPETARAEAWRLKAELLRAADTGGGGDGRGKRKRRRLTASLVESLKPGEITWDREVTGFGARRQRINRVYFLKARIGRRQRWITIGTHGADWSPDSARREAQRLLAEIAAGSGPAAAPPPRRNLTLAALCDRYLKEGCAGKQASTMATDRGRIERHIKPLLGGKRLAAVTSADVEGFVAAVTAGETATDVRTRPRGRAIVTGGAGTATRTLGLLSAIFGFAVQRGLLDANPVRGVRREAPRRAPQPLGADALARLGGSLAAAEQEGADAGAVAALRLMVLTGCRSNELIALTWADVDLDRASLRLSDGDKSRRFVALSPLAAALLRGLPRGPAEAPVLPGQSRPGRLPSLAPLWRTVRTQAGLPELRVQELAGCFAALGPAAMERFLHATPPRPLVSAPRVALEAAGEAASASAPRVAMPASRLAPSSLMPSSLAPNPLAPRPPAVTPLVPAPPEHTGPLAVRPAADVGPAVSLGPEAMRPSAALLAWRAKAEASGDAKLEIDAAD